MIPTDIATDVFNLVEIFTRLAERGRRIGVQRFSGEKPDPNETNPMNAQTGDPNSKRNADIVESASAEMHESA